MLDRSEATDHETRVAENTFWSKVKKTDTCWLWTGSFVPGGYGNFRHRSITMLAHRYSLKIHGIHFTKEQVIRHTCDVRACVRPDHLVPGTRAENARDAVNRGRYPEGELSIRSKLRESQVVEILDEYLTKNATTKHLASRFSVTENCIESIVSGRTWKKVPRPQSTRLPRRHGKLPEKPKMTPGELWRIKIEFNYTYQDIAEITGRSVRSISRYMNGKSAIPRRVSSVLEEMCRKT